MAWLFAIAAVLFPIFGAVLSMLSHRYAYMNMTSVMSFIFMVVAYYQYRDK